MMNYKPITNHEQYLKVAYRLEQLKNAEPATTRALELKLMTTLILEYEIEKSKTEDRSGTGTAHRIAQNKNSYQ